MKRMKMNITRILMTCLLALTATVSYGQSRHYNAQTLGMGGGGTAFIDGFHANFVNPANLAVDNYHYSTTIGFVNPGLTAGGTAAKIGVYNDYLTSGLTIDGQLREDFMNDWFNNGNDLDMNTTANTVLFGFSHQTGKQAFSLALRNRITAEGTFNRGLADLYFYGPTSDRYADPVPVNFDLRGVAFSEISFGYSMEVMTIPDLIIAKDVKLYAGIAPKLLLGHYTGSASFNSTLQIGNQPGGFALINDFSYSLETIGELSNQLRDFEQQRDQDPSTALDDVVTYDGGDVLDIQGRGFGVDLGATVEMDVSRWPIPLFLNSRKTLRVSMAVTDIGGLTFDDNASRVFADGTFTYRGAEGQENVGDYFDNLADSLENDVYGDFATEASDGFRYSLPGMYNFGASLEMGRLIAAVDYGFGFNNNGVNSRRSVLNLGLQYRLFGFMPLRVGMRSGGYSSAAYSAGFGFDFNFLEFSFAAATTANSARNGGSGAVATSGILIRF